MKMNEEIIEAIFEGIIGVTIVIGDVRWLFF